MTRHELKELETDQFSQKVSSAVEYAVTHRSQVIRWGIVAAVLIAAAIGGGWYYVHQKTVRQAELGAALSIVEAQVGSAQSQFVKSFPTEEAKNQAAAKALADVASKHSGTKEGLFAQYYLGTLKADQGDMATAERNLKDVANSSSEVSGLAKLALAQIYAGQNKLSDARNLLDSLIQKPTGLVSKEQAQLVLAELLSKSNPQEANRLIGPLKEGKNVRPAVSRAAEMLSAQVKK